MKKILLSILAVAALASCAKEEVISYDKSPIGFGNAFVDNATKAIYAVANDITGFTVFGNVKGTGANTVALYGNTGATVTRGTADLGAAWTCNMVRYWTPSCTYNFAAVANGTVNAVDVVNGIPTKINYTVIPTEPADLIYATASATTDGSSNVTATSGSVNNGIVCFTFNHLLSKVYFTVTHSLGNDYTIDVTNIAVTDVQDKGIYTIATETWANDGDGKTDLSFKTGGETNAQLLIPVTQTLGVTITYDITFNGEKIATGATKTGTVAATPYAKNTVYNIAAVIGLNEIKFTTTALNGFATPEQNGTVTIQ